MRMTGALRHFLFTFQCWREKVHMQLFLVTVDNDFSMTKVMYHVFQQFSGRSPVEYAAPASRLQFLPHKTVRFTVVIECYADHSLYFLQSLQTKGYELTSKQSKTIPVTTVPRVLPFTYVASNSACRGQLVSSTTSDNSYQDFLQDTVYSFQNLFNVSKAISCPTLIILLFFSKTHSRLLTKTKTLETVHCFFALDFPSISCQHFIFSWICVSFFEFIFQWIVLPDTVTSQSDTASRANSLLPPNFTTDSMAAVAAASAAAASVGQFNILSLTAGGPTSATSSPAFSQYSMDSAYSSGGYSSNGDMSGYMAGAGATLPSLHTTARPTPYSRNPTAVYPYYYAGRPPRSFTGYEYACTGRQY